ncbi:T9SS type A sorting domain-containing protein [Dyadobacter sp. LHD-138]|uniref:T9SS type A sorting domain-containing protein n=1 Tax=Dyadobacter sp. LHD-138 TaxID=3071413 RepID=UPI0027DEAD6A|nr:T9SS type A sorting domain-containing protein [Dyadobacter sp. LHD-138]MDQ6480382.1 T9SS type A sorting domain-containing protein [Dyadobacter sp. LHD-138]
MKKQLYLLILLLVLSSEVTFAQSRFNLPIWKILNGSDAGSAKLPDGTLVTVTKIKRSNPTFGVNMGKAKPHGGFLDGLNNANAPEVIPNGDALTISEYLGSKDPGLFTNISAPTLEIEDGFSASYNKAVGYHIRFSKPTVYSNFLFLDIDGEVDVPFSNQEWSVAFGFNGDAYIAPTITLSPGTNLDQERGPKPVGPNHGWRDLVSGIISPAAALNLPAGMRIVSQQNQQDSKDPDEIKNQYLASFNEPVTDFFVLWGIVQSFRDAGNADDNVQNSAISPISVELSPDFGDAPQSYKTLYDVDALLNGPSHGIVPTLRLGATVNSEADGQPGTGADRATDDDGVASLPNITLAQTVVSYTLTTSFTNDTGLPAFIVAWLDINNNGKFDASEGIKKSLPANQTSGSVPFEWTGFTIATGNQTYARFRITTEAITTADIGGAFINGEIEDYKIALVSTPLPVTLIRLTAGKSTEGIGLTWKTAQEKDFSHFEVEKSADARQFRKIGTVAGADQGLYHFNDSAPAEGNNYYRLKMVDLDGSSAISRVLHVNYEANPTYLLVENPTKGGQFQVITNASAPSFELYNSLGGKVEVKHSGEPADQTYTMKVKGQPSGLYILRMLYNGKVISKKIIFP